MPKGIYLHRPLSEEHKRKIGKANFGEKNHNFGQSPSKETRRRMRASSQRISGDQHPNWKGDKVGYRQLHRWVNKNISRPNKCENSSCVYPREDANGKMMLKPKRLHLANISGHYKREASDWIRLCPSCHKIYDKNTIHH